jgi:hypothetical protein
MSREEKSGEGVYGEAWYCRVADEAIERIW